MEALVERAVAEFGALDVMVNNAGIHTLTSAVDKTEAEWLAVIGVDLTGVWFGCQAALRQLVRQGRGGRIINVSPRLALQGVAPGRADYCAAKGGGVEPHPQLAVEAPRHRRQRDLPGFIVTDATRELAAAGKLDEVRRRTPYRRLGTPEDVAGCAVFLASADSEFVTGQNLVVDGALDRGLTRPADPREQRRRRDMDLLYEVKDGVATLTLNRPEKLNAVTDAMREALARHVDAINHDPEVRVAIVRGAGTRAFSAGSDIYETTGRTPVEKRDTVEREAPHLLRRCTKPVVAMVRGYALGGAWSWRSPAT